MIKEITISFSAGFISLLSPCVFPLIPAYLSYISGISHKEIKENQVSRFGLFFKTLVFITGFSLVFIIFGRFSTGMSDIYLQTLPLFFIIAGIIIILFGLYFIFDFSAFLKDRNIINTKHIPTGYIGVFVFGFALGLGLIDCIAPFVESILIRTGRNESAFRGIILLCFYLAGTGIPFLLFDFFFSFFLKNLKKINPYPGIIKKISGCFLILLGVLIMIGSFQSMNEALLRIAVGLENWRQKHPAILPIIFSILFLIPALIILIFYIRKIAVKKEKLISPIRIFFMVFFFTISLLVFSNVIDIIQLIYYWFNFSGI